MTNEIEHNLNIQKTLKDFGIEDNSIEIYLKLLENKRMTLSKLSRETGIAKTTTFENTNKLLERGLISKVIEGNRIYLRAESPSKLKDLLFEEKRLLEDKLEKIELLERQMPQIQKTIDNIVANIPEETIALARTFQGKHGFRAVCNQSLDKAKDEILFISNHNYWRKVFTEEYDSSNYVPTRIEKGIKMKSLVIKNEQGRRLQNNDKGLLRETRFLPSDINLNTTFIVYSGEVSLMVSTKPYIAINIQSDVIYKAFKSIFLHLWDNAKLQ